MLKSLQIDEAMATIRSEGFRILGEEAEEEICLIVKELRSTLDPRLAGKIDGIEWVFTTLVERIKIWEEEQNAI